MAKTVFIQPYGPLVDLDMLENPAPGPSPVQIFITLGGGIDLAITKDEHLVMIDYTGYRIDFGVASDKRIQDLREYFQRLACHAVEEKVI